VEGARIRRHSVYIPIIACHLIRGAVTRNEPAWPRWHTPAGLA